MFPGFISFLDVQRSRFLAPTRAHVPHPDASLRMGPLVNARELNGDFGMTPLGRVERMCIQSRFTALAPKETALKNPVTG